MLHQGQRWFIGRQNAEASGARQRGADTIEGSIDIFALKALLPSMTDTTALAIDAIQYRGRVRAEPGRPP